MTEAKKAWIVRFNVAPEALEEELNKMADDGYQAFRIEQELVNCNGGSWVVVAFDPSQIAERQGRALTETLTKLAGLPSMGPTPGPAR